MVHVLAFVAGGLVEHPPVVPADELNARRVGRTAADQEGGIAMCDGERRRRERPLRRIAVFLVGPDPVFAGVLALHVLAAGEDAVPLDRLTGERFARRRPVLEGPAFEIEVQRLAIGPLREDSLRSICLGFLLGDDRYRGQPQHNHQTAETNTAHRESLFYGSGIRARLESETTSRVIPQNTGWLPKSHELPASAASQWLITF